MQESVLVVPFIGKGRDAPLTSSQIATVLPLDSPKSTESVVEVAFRDYFNRIF